jgi:hypothetical protein
VPLPKPIGEAPWTFTAACWSERRDSVRAVGFLADGSICAGREGEKDDGSDCGYWEVWTHAGGTPVRSARPVGTTGFEFPMCVHPGGLVTDRFRRFDPVTFKPLAALSFDMTLLGRGQGGGLDAACPVGNKKFVVGTVTPAGEPRTVRLLVVWEADSGKVLTGRQVKTGQDLKTVAADHTGDTMATGTREGAIVMLSTRSGGREWDAPNTAKGVPNPVGEVALSPDGKKLYSSHTGERVVLVWNVADGKQEGTLPVPWLIHAMAVSPDGRWLATVGEAVVVWDLERKPPTGYELAEHWAGNLEAVCFSPDGNRLVVGGWARRGRPATEGEGVVWLWDLKP